MDLHSSYCSEVYSLRLVYRLDQAILLWCMLPQSKAVQTKLPGHGFGQMSSSYLKFLMSHSHCLGCVQECANKKDWQVTFEVYDLCYSCTMATRGLRGMREWRRYIDHEGGA